VSRDIHTEPLTAEAFAPFGDVLEARGAPDRIINQGLCGRFHDRARVDFGRDGRAGISIFLAEKRMLPLKLEMVERHPDGSQAFFSITGARFLIIVAPDFKGHPGAPRAFLTAEGQGVNFLKDTWHGVLTPLVEPGLFAVIDRIGPTANLQEYWFDEPYVIHK